MHTPEKISSTSHPEQAPADLSSLQQQEHQLYDEVVEGHEQLQKHIDEARKLLATLPHSQQGYEAHIHAATVNTLEEHISKISISLPHIADSTREQYTQAYTQIAEQYLTYLINYGSSDTQKLWLIAKLLPALDSNKQRDILATYISSDRMTYDSHPNAYGRQQIMYTFTQGLSTTEKQLYREKMHTLLDENKQLRTYFAVGKRDFFDLRDYVPDEEKDAQLSPQQQHRYTRLSPNHIQGEDILGKPKADIAAGKYMDTKLLLIDPLDTSVATDLIEAYETEKTPEHAQKLLDYAQILTTNEPQNYPLAAQLYTTILTGHMNTDNLFKQEIQKTWQTESSLVQKNESLQSIIPRQKNPDILAFLVQQKVLGTWINKPFNQLTTQQQLTAISTENFFNKLATDPTQDISHLRNVESTLVRQETQEQFANIVKNSLQSLDPQQQQAFDELKDIQQHLPTPISVTKEGIPIMKGGNVLGYAIMFFIGVAVGGYAVYNMIPKSKAEIKEISKETDYGEIFKMFKVVSAEQSTQITLGSTFYHHFVEQEDNDHPRTRSIKDGYNNIMKDQDNITVTGNLQVGIDLSDYQINVNDSSGKETDVNVYNDEQGIQVVIPRMFVNSFITGVEESQVSESFFSRILPSSMSSEKKQQIKKETHEQAKKRAIQDAKNNGTLEKLLQVAETQFTKDMKKFISAMGTYSSDQIHIEFTGEHLDENTYEKGFVPAQEKMTTTPIDSSNN